ncbi:MAG: 4'-phosphopantetheinyl transferase superfamily protein [Prevotellaceae bacterium]|nr:4'-phosphopantetheinyl transferase superfamily protein [Prevotellaceae bacterium]
MLTTKENETYALYVDDDLQRFSNEEIESLIRQFPKQRRETLLAYRNLEARRQGALAYLLLCNALRERFGLEAPDFAFNEHGKPFFLNYPDIHFNLSHCRNAVACALSREPIGVDIESIRTAKPAIVRHTMSDEEARTILSAADPNLQFTILWTRKEALLKLRGTGIAADLPGVLTDCDAHIDTTIHDTFVCSVAQQAQTGIRMVNG